MKYVPPTPGRAEIARNELREHVAAFNPEALLADGFEDAFIGMAVRCSKQPLAVYDARKCIAILMARDGMDEEGAQEFFDFNTLGAWAGENTPLFLWRFDKDVP